MHLRTSSFQPGGITTSHQESLADHREERVPGTGSAQPYLRVCFFGHFELLCGDEPASLGCNTRALAILKYLLARRRRPVSQDYLMGWLWPESDLKRARWSLNSAIYALRKLLRDQLPPDASSDFVLLDKGHYRLDPTVEIWTDTEEFEARYEHGRYLERTQRKSEAVAEYEEATGLYRDDYLVEDLYEDWTMVPREWFANVYMDMLSWLARYYMETGRYQESIRTCYRLLENDRCHEDGRHLLMECYAHLGLRRRALHQYRLSETALKRSRGTGAQSEGQDLYHRLSER
jgi:LuxR family maltose regulon positive regulatory protein